MLKLLLLGTLTSSLKGTFTYWLQTMTKRLVEDKEITKIIWQWSIIPAWSVNNVELFPVYTCYRDIWLAPTPSPPPPAPLPSFKCKHLKAGWWKPIKLFLAEAVHDEEVEYWSARLQTELNGFSIIDVLYLLHRVNTSNLLKVTLYFWP